MWTKLTAQENVAPKVEKRIKKGRVRDVERYSSITREQNESTATESVGSKMHTKSRMSHRTAPSAMKTSASRRGSRERIVAESV